MVHFPGRDRDFKICPVKHPAFLTGFPSRGGDAGGKPGRGHPGHWGCRVPGDGQGGRGDIRENSPTAMRASPAGILPQAGGHATGLHSEIRIRVKNTIRRIMIFRIIKEGCRNGRSRYDQSIRKPDCGVAGRTILLKRDGPYLGKAAAGRPGVEGAWLLITDQVSGRPIPSCRSSRRLCREWSWTGRRTRVAARRPHAILWHGPEAESRFR